MNFVIERPDLLDTSYDEPTVGKWYQGINQDNTIGAVAQFTGASFESSAGLVDMSKYAFIRESSRVRASLMELPELGDSPDKEAIRLALRWLETLSKNKCLMWAPEQKEACQKALADAKAAL